MGTTASYSVWFTVQIAHEYYSGNKSGIELLPAAGTLKILQKEGIIMKCLSKDTWTFLWQKAVDTDTPVEIKDDLEFYMKPVDAGFYYFTDNENQEGKGWQVKDPDSAGVWKMLTIGMDDKLPAAGTDFHITISSAKKCLEFIVIDKAGTYSNDKLIVKEDMGRLSFLGISKIKFPGEALPVFRFVTKNPVTLKEIYDYHISLLKQKDTTEILLSSTMPLPKPSSISAISPKDTISSYFYF
jgi:hypothetical protein